ncbi:MAG: hypothetical protein LBQ43_04035 [Holosporales bacterium]|nr:hypothetical protein [Holosporales bacterium]
MKKIIYACIMNAFCASAYCSDSEDFDSDPGFSKYLRALDSTKCKPDEYRVKRRGMTEEERFEADKRWWTCYSREGRKGYNKIDAESLKTKLLHEVEGDDVATGAMNLFLQSNFWELVDYCTDNLDAMQETNNQKFKEILILLAPGLEATRYKKKVTAIIRRNGHRSEVTRTAIQHINFCLDMFSYVAVENAKRGRVAMAEMCKHAFYALPPTDNKKHLELYIREMFGGARFDDWPSIEYRFQVEKVWPNWKK